MRITTFRVRTTPSDEMHANRGSVRRWFMGKIAHLSSTTVTSLEEFLADGNFIRIVNIAARRPLVAGS
jgi:hypothetical protein